MGCLDVNSRKKQDTQGCLTVGFKGDNKIKVSLSRIGNDPTATIISVQPTGCISFKRNPLGKVYFNRISDGTITFDRKLGGISVHTGLVCTVSLGYDGSEMWWCNDWKVMWNNGVPTLWK